ncbi:Mth938-like domain-containing protein [Dinoroseobacter sp. S76]|uniref:Mth938-like domain-containing protein n=1 Tax=Dinoroseobacter sp. S76 TaxID=3415124 RepID=UPI003C7D398D
MRLNEVVYSDAQPVEGYGPGFFRVGGEVHHGALYLSPAGVQRWGGLEDLGPLNAEEIDVLFLGMGAEIAHAPAAFRDAVEGQGIGLEVMSSPAACRTYNVLLSEGRRVGLALLPVVEAP